MYNENAPRLCYIDQSTSEHLVIVSTSTMIYVRMRGHYGAVRRLSTVLQLQHMLMVETDTFPQPVWQKTPQSCVVQVSVWE